MTEATKRYIKNMDLATVSVLSEQVGYQPGQIVSKTLAQNKAVSLTLFAFDKGEEISSHKSDGDAMVMVLDGTGEVTIDGEKFLLNAGESIIMPANKPHAVFAAEQFKMFLIVIFPQ
jgi:quercetin dioxygenase-like cupin family protein